MREQAIEAGALAILGKDEACKRWGIKCVTHTTNYLSSNFSNQSEVECDRVREARRQSAAVVDAVEPIIRADERAQSGAWIARANAESIEAEVRERLRAQVKALTTLPLGGWDVVFLKDVLALVGGAQPPDPSPTTPTRVSTDVRDSIIRGTVR
jgi:hypothetical protein